MVAQQLIPTSTVLSITYNGNVANAPTVIDTDVGVRYYLEASISRFYRGVWEPIRGGFVDIVFDGEITATRRSNSLGVVKWPIGEGTTFPVREGTIVWEAFRRHSGLEQESRSGEIILRGIVGVAPPPVITPPEVTPPITPPTAPPIVTPVESTGLPWESEERELMVQHYTGLAEAGITRLGVVADAIGNIVAFFKDPVGAIITRLSDLFARGSEQSLDLAIKGTQEASEESPQEKTALEQAIGVIDISQFTKVRDFINEYKAFDERLEGAKASEYLNSKATMLVNIHRNRFNIHAFTEALSLGQFEYWKDYWPMVVAKTGIDEITKQATLLPLEKSVLIPAEQYYNAKYTPLIPPYVDLVSMRIKEVITPAEFELYLSLQGFDVDWATKIYQSRFTAPSLTQLLTMFRRGLRDAEWLRNRQILVELDPRFNDVWEQMWYRDPTPRQGRWMYEEGSINYDTLRDLVVRAGMFPEYVEPFAQMLARFQERPYKREYLDTVARGYRQDVYTADELRAEVVNSGFSVGTADWIIQTEDVRRKIEIARPPVERVRLLALGDLKKAYVLDKIDEGEFRTELLDRGYEMGDINILIAVLNESKLVQEEGTRIVVLTVAQLRDAWKHDVIDEDDFRARLFDRGLSLLEINILVETLKRKWGRT